MRRIELLAIACGLSALAQWAGTARAADTDLDEAKALAGQKRWISGIAATVGVPFCPRPSAQALIRDCRTLKSGRFTYVSALRPPGMSEGIWFQVRLDDGRLGF